MTDAVAGSGPLPDAASTILVKIMSPSPEVPENLSFPVPASTTIDHLKKIIRDSIDAKPSPDRQRLIYRGKVLDGNSAIGPTLIGNSEKEESYTLHLVIRPPVTTQPTANAPTSNFFPIPQQNPFSSSPINTTGRFNRNEPVINGPLGAPLTQQTTITRQDSNGRTTITTRTSHLTASFSRQAIPPSTLHPRTQEILNEIRDRSRATRRDPEVPSNPTIAAEPATVEPTTGSSTGMSRPNLHDRRTGDGAQEPGFEMRFYLPQTTSPPSSEGPNSNATQQNSNTTNGSMSDEDTARRRVFLDDLQEIEEPERIADVPPTNFIGADAPPLATPSLNFPDQSSVYTIPPGSSIYLLQDPYHRIHSILVGPPGTSYQPMPPNGLPEMLRNPLYDPNIMPPIPPMGLIPGFTAPGAVQNPAFAAQVAAQVEQAAALQRQMLLNNPLFAQNNPPFPQANHNIQIHEINLNRIFQRLRDRAGHFWLAVKLIVFVILFAGNSGWRRIAYFSGIAIAIFLWQTGLAAELARPILEAINPPPPPRPQQQRQQQGQAAPNPARMAQMMVDRRDDSFARTLRALQRGVGIFLASLIPGMHERHVDAVQAAQEVRQRAEDLQQELQQGIQNAGGNQQQPQAEQPQAQQPQQQA